MNALNVDVLIKIQDQNRFFGCLGLEYQSFKNSFSSSPSRRFSTTKFLTCFCISALAMNLTPKVVDELLHYELGRKNSDEGHVVSNANRSTTLEFSNQFIDRTGVEDAGFLD